MKLQCKPTRKELVGRSSPPLEDHSAYTARNRGVETQERPMFAAGTLRGIVVTLILGILFLPQAAYPHDSVTDDNQIALELEALGKRGSVISRIREHTLAMLQTENACSGWFGETDPDTPEVFRSLHYELEDDGTTYVLHKLDADGSGLFKHPWAARSIENAGRNSTIRINPSGPFFRPMSAVLELDPGGRHPWPEAGFHRLLVGSFSGNTTRAQITALLHELGHIVGRLPPDNNTWDGRSSRNTNEVVRHCKQEIDATAEKISRRGI